MSLVFFTTSKPANFFWSKKSLATRPRLAGPLGDSSVACFATTRKIIAMLQVMLRYAISLDLLTFNAAKDVEVNSTPCG